MTTSGSGGESSPKGFWRNLWDVAGFTLAVYAGIAVCVVGFSVFMMFAN
jgi:hypothetical protein